MSDRNFTVIGTQCGCEFERRTFDTYRAARTFSEKLHSRAYGFELSFPLLGGRIVTETIQPNGSRLATPTPGNYAMTAAEWDDYCSVIR